MKTKTTALGLVFGLAAMATSVLPASAQTTIGVGLTQTGGSRTVAVEDLAGSPLTSLELNTGRSLPFRVHVTDSSYDRKAFTVSATMTNLYKSTGASSFDFGTKISSANVSVDRLTAPVDALSVSALVKPAFTVLATITDPILCAKASLPVVGGVCTTNLNSQLDGVNQTVNSVVDLSNLSKLPLVPQAPQPGAFTNPDFQGVGAGDAAGIAAAGSSTPTPHQVVGGILGVSPFLTAVQSTLAATVGATPAASLVAGGQSQLLATLQNTIGVPTILTSQVTFAASLVPLVASNILAQSGTYYSYPVLNVNSTGASQGSYRGTLIFTTIES